jgi:hypothetical protein
MAERGLGHAHPEQIVSREAAVARLRQRVITDPATEFAADPVGHDVLCVVEFRYPDAATAHAAAARLPGSDPLGQATRGVLDHGATVRLDRVHRRDLGALGAEARAGDVLGPSEPGTVVYGILEVRPAALDGATRRSIEERLFRQRLTDQRRTVTLEWCWGTAPRTAALTATLQGPSSG